MGSRLLSRSLNPLGYGEGPEECPKCVLVLRAWAIWRMQMHGWAERRPGRMRQVAADEAKLLDAVRALGEADLVLGHERLNRLFEVYVAGVAFSLRHPEVSM